jgi:cysteinyl-tRNA synthetase
MKFLSITVSMLGAASTAQLPLFASGFALSSSSINIHNNNNFGKSLSSAETLNVLLKSTAEDGDGGGEDWFSDYDESKFNKNSNDEDSGGSSAGYRGGAPPKANRNSGDSNSGGEYYNHGRDGGHDYTRDLSKDTSNVDEDTVNRLLSERIGAKRQRDFDTADAIRDQLASEFGVAVFDRELTWRTGWTSGGTRRPQGGRDGGGARGGRRPAVDFGPNGHDYLASPDMGPNTSNLSELDIHAMLAERLEAKLGRQFNVADRIQADLIQGGVFVHDGRKEWRADGIAFGDLRGGDGRPGRTSGSRSDRNRAYEKSVHSPPVPEGKDDLVTALVNERLKYKELRDFEKADAVREGLRTKFNVIIDDKLKQWSIGGDFGTEHRAQRDMMTAYNERGYVKSGSSELLPIEDEDYIQAKVDERREAKRDRNFETADVIREELEGKYNLMINDRLKMWSVGGDFGADGGPRKPRGAYTRRGGGDLSDEDIENINKLLMERSMAKKERDFDTSDNIRDGLRADYNIAIDDKSNEWHVLIDHYVQAKSEGDAELDDARVAMVTQLVEERKECKANRNYDRADSIRDELKDDFDVVMDDRTKEWRYTPASAGQSSSGGGGW